MIGSFHMAARLIAGYLAFADSVGENNRMLIARQGVHSR